MLTLKETFTQWLCSNLVNELLHPGLEPPDLEFDCDQLVGTHDGLLAFDPALLQHPPVGLLRLEVPKVLHPNKQTKQCTRETRTHKHMESSIHTKTLTHRSLSHLHCAHFHSSLCVSVHFCNRGAK